MSNSKQLVFANDPYEQFIQQEKFQNNLIEIDKSSKFSKKVNKLKQALIAAKANMINGAMMGFMVGGLFGLVIGLYSAVQTRRLIAIPMSILVSGGSFGFILGCGSVVRSDTILQKQLENYEDYIQLEKDEWMNVYNFNQAAKQGKFNIQEVL